MLLMALSSAFDPSRMQSHIQRNSNEVPYGPSLLGRIIDGMGRPVDDKGPLGAPVRNGFFEPPNPLSVLQNLLSQRVLNPLTVSIPMARAKGWGFLRSV